MTRSRSGLLAFAIGLLVFLGLRFSKSFLLLTPILLLAATLYTFTLLHCDTSTTVGTESFCIRRIVWKGALNAWLHSAKTVVVGWGPETFTQAYYRYRPIAHNLTSEWELLYNKAHNEYLHYLTTTGLLGLSAYLYLLFSMFRTIKSQIQISKSETNSKLEFQKLENYLGFRISDLEFAMLSGWTTLLATNFFGFSVIITNLFLFLFPALSISLNNQTVNDKINDQMTKWSNALIVFPFFALCILLFALVRYTLADISYAAGHTYLAAFQSDLTAASLVISYDRLSRAFQLNPSEPTISSELALATAYSAVATRDLDATYSAQLASQAAALAQLSTLQSPNPNFYRTQSKIYLLLNQPASAAGALAEAARLSPSDPRIPSGLAALYSQLGDASASAAFASSASRLKPDLKL